MSERMCHARAFGRTPPFAALVLAGVVVAAPPLEAQTTYNSYAFTTLAGAAGVSGSADGIGASAQFNMPSGVAADANGNVYVADYASCTVRRVALNGSVTTFAGTPGVNGHQDGPGPAASFNVPIGVAVDGDGNVYVADSGNNTIRKITPQGVVTTLAGTAGVAGRADGTGASAQFYMPTGVAVDREGNVYVADSRNYAIRKITPAGVVTTLAGNPGRAGDADGTGGAASFYGPFSVGVDGSGNVYTFDSGVRKITPGGAVTTIGCATPADPYAPLDNVSLDGPAGTAQFSGPAGLAVDASGDVFVADGANRTIRELSSDGVVYTLAGLPGLDGSADGTGPAAQFSAPYGLAVDGNGNLYATDIVGHTVRAGRAVAKQSPATVSLSGLYQLYDGTPKGASAATSPAGLQTVVAYSTLHAPGGTLGQPPYHTVSLAPPSAQGSYGVFAAVVDPEYTGSAYATLTLGSGVPAAPQPYAVRNARAGGNFLWGVAIGPAGLVAVGDAGDILSSPDGITWTHQASGTTNWLTAVTYGAGLFVAVGDNGCVLSSADGVTWTGIAQAATANRLNNVLYAAGQFVAVGEGGAIVSSPDGRNWTACNSGVSGWLRGLAYTGEAGQGTFSTSIGPLPATVPARFVAAGQGGVLVTSTDGKTWVGFGYMGEETASEDIEGLVGAPSSNFVALGAGGALFTNDLVGGGTLDFTYEDLDVYGPSSMPAVHYRGLVQGGGSLVLTGEAGTILTGPGISGPWAQVSSGTTANLVAGLAIGDSVFLVGENETILQSTRPYDSRLVNLSCRARVGTGGDILIAGFVVGGQGSEWSFPLGALIRASGPALQAFGVPGTLPDPELQLFETDSRYKGLLRSNSGWGANLYDALQISSSAEAAGAFPWTDTSSHDAAMSEELQNGSYTANVSGSSGDTGVAIAEVYDLTLPDYFGPTCPRLINMSARSYAGSGLDSLIAGFVIGGSSPKTVLIRASGPALIPFGVAGILPDPMLQLFSTGSGSTLLASNTGWGGDPRIVIAAARTGAFSWGSSATADSALLVTLAPGPYTANVTGAGGDTGVVLVEVYEVQ